MKAASLVLVGMAISLSCAQTPGKSNEVPLTATEAQQMAAIDSLEIALSAKVNDLVSTIGGDLNTRRNAIWMNACQRSGWPIEQCKTDPTFRVVRRDTSVPAPNHNSTQAVPAKPADNPVKEKK